MDADLEAARSALIDGLVVGVPTDTVYGVAADAYRGEAVASLYALKQRPEERAIPVLVSSLDQADAIADVGEAGRRLAAEHWPGPLTLVVARRRGLPPWIGDAAGGTVGIRVPDHARLLDLLEIAGPLATTSANRSGENPALDADGAQAIFADSVAHYVVGSCPGGSGSTVLDVTGDEPVLLRAGPVAWP